MCVWSIMSRVLFLLIGLLWHPVLIPGLEPRDDVPTRGPSLADQVSGAVDSHDGTRAIEPIKENTSQNYTQNWLRKSIEVNGGKVSAHNRSDVDVQETEKVAVGRSVAFLRNDTDAPTSHTQQEGNGIRWAVNNASEPTVDKGNDTLVHRKFSPKTKPDVSYGVEVLTEALNGSAKSQVQQGANGQSTPGISPTLVTFDDSGTTTQLNSLGFINSFEIINYTTKMLPTSTQGEKKMNIVDNKQSITAQKPHLKEHGVGDQKNNNASVRNVFRNDTQGNKSSEQNTSGDRASVSVNSDCTEPRSESVSPKSSNIMTDMVAMDAVETEVGSSPTTKMFDSWESYFGVVSGLIQQPGATGDTESLRSSVEKPRVSWSDLHPAENSPAVSKRRFKGKTFGGDSGIRQREEVGDRRTKQRLKRKQERQYSVGSNEDYGTRGVAKDESKENLPQVSSERYTDFLTPNSTEQEWSLEKATSDSSTEQNPSSTSPRNQDDGRAGEKPLSDPHSHPDGDSFEYSGERYRDFFKLTSSEELSPIFQESFELSSERSGRASEEHEATKSGRRDKKNYSRVIGMRQASHEDEGVTTERNIVPGHLRLPKNLHVNDLDELVNAGFFDVMKADKEDSGNLEREENLESRQLSDHEEHGDDETLESGEEETSTSPPDETEVRERYRVSEHENPPEPPTRPNYTHEGQWARPTLEQGIDLQFIPIQNYAQVRRYETVRHLTPEDALAEATTDEEYINAPRLREVVSHKKTSEVYSEEGYEDSAYDHGGYNKEGEHHEVLPGYESSAVMVRPKDPDEVLDHDDDDHSVAESQPSGHRVLLDGSPAPPHAPHYPVNVTARGAPHNGNRSKHGAKKTTRGSWSIKQIAKDDSDRVVVLEEGGNITSPTTLRPAYRSARVFVPERYAAQHGNATTPAAQTREGASSKGNNISTIPGSRNFTEPRQMPKRTGRRRQKTKHKGYKIPPQLLGFKYKVESKKPQSKGRKNSPLAKRKRKMKEREKNKKKNRLSQDMSNLMKKHPQKTSNDDLSHMPARMKDTNKPLAQLAQVQHIQSTTPLPMFHPNHRYTENAQSFVRQRLTDAYGKVPNIALPSTTMSSGLDGRENRQKYDTTNFQSPGQFRMLLSAAIPVVEAMSDVKSSSSLLRKTQTNSLTDENRNTLISASGNNIRERLKSPLLLGKTNDWSYWNEMRHPHAFNPDSRMADPVIPDIWPAKKKSLHTINGQSANRALWHDSYTQSLLDTYSDLFRPVQRRIDSMQDTQINEDIRGLELRRSSPGKLNSKREAEQGSAIDTPAGKDNPSPVPHKFPKTEAIHQLESRIIATLRKGDLRELPTNLKHVQPVFRNTLRQRSNLTRSPTLATKVRTASQTNTTDPTSLRAVNGTISSYKQHLPKPIALLGSPVSNIVGVNESKITSPKSKQNWNASTVDSLEAGDKPVLATPYVVQLVEKRLPGSKNTQTSRSHTEPTDNKLKDDFPRVTGEAMKTAASGTRTHLQIPPHTLHRKEQKKNDKPRELDSETSHYKPVIMTSGISVNTQKYPFYRAPTSDKLTPYSPLRYANNPWDIPIKTEGGMEFYESRDKVVQCEEPQPPKNVIPVRDEDGEWNGKPQPEGPRMGSLGDVIGCLRVKLFGQNPLDNPFFKETTVGLPKETALVGTLMDAKGTPAPKMSDQMGFYNDILQNIRQASIRPKPGRVKNRPYIRIGLEPLDTDEVSSEIHSVAYVTAPNTKQVLGEISSWKSSDSELNRGNVPSMKKNEQERRAHMTQNRKEENKEPNATIIKPTHSSEEIIDSREILIVGKGNLQGGTESLKRDSHKLNLPASNISDSETAKSHRGNPKSDSFYDAKYDIRKTLQHELQASAEESPKEHYRNSTYSTGNQEDDQGTSQSSSVEYYVDIYGRPVAYRRGSQIQRSNEHRDGRKTMPYYNIVRPSRAESTYHKQKKDYPDDDDVEDDSEHHEDQDNDEEEETHHPEETHDQEGESHASDVESHVPEDESQDSEDESHDSEEESHHPEEESHDPEVKSQSHEEESHHPKESSGDQRNHHKSASPNTYAVVEEPETDSQHPLRESATPQNKSGTADSTSVLPERTSAKQPPQLITTSPQNLTANVKPSVSVSDTNTTDNNNSSAAVSNSGLKADPRNSTTLSLLKIEETKYPRQIMSSFGNTKAISNAAPDLHTNGSDKLEKGNQFIAAKMPLPPVSASVMKKLHDSNISLEKYLQWSGKETSLDKKRKHITNLKYGSKYAPEKDVTPPDDMIDYQKLMRSQNAKKVLRDVDVSDEDIDSSQTSDFVRPQSYSKDFSFEKHNGNDFGVSEYVHSQTYKVKQPMFPEQKKKTRDRLTLSSTKPKKGSGKETQAFQPNPEGTPRLGKLLYPIKGNYGIKGYHLGEMGDLVVELPSDSEQDKASKSQDKYAHSGRPTTEEARHVLSSNKDAERSFKDTQSEENPPKSDGTVETVKHTLVKPYTYEQREDWGDHDFFTDMSDDEDDYADGQDDTDIPEDPKKKIVSSSKVTKVVLSPGLSRGDGYSKADGPAVTEEDKTVVNYTSSIEETPLPVTNYKVLKSESIDALKKEHETKNEPLDYSSEKDDYYDNKDGAEVAVDYKEDDEDEDEVTRPDGSADNHPTDLETKEESDNTSQTSKESNKPNASDEKKTGSARNDLSSGKQRLEAKGDDYDDKDEDYVLYDDSSQSKEVDDTENDREGKEIGDRSNEHTRNGSNSDENESATQAPLREEGSEEVERNPDTSGKTITPSTFESDEENSTTEKLLIIENGKSKFSPTLQRPAIAAKVVDDDDGDDDDDSDDNEEEYDDKEGGSDEEETDEEADQKGKERKLNPSGKYTTADRQKENAATPDVAPFPSAESSVDQKSQGELIFDAKVAAARATSPLLEPSSLASQPQATFATTSATAYTTTLSCPQPDGCIGESPSIRGTSESHTTQIYDPAGTNLPNIIYPRIPVQTVSKDSSNTRFTNNSSPNLQANSLAVEVQNGRNLNNTYSTESTTILQPSSSEDVTSTVASVRVATQALTPHVPYDITSQKGFTTPPPVASSLVPLIKSTPIMLPPVRRTEAGTPEDTSSTPFPSYDGTFLR